MWNDKPDKIKRTISTLNLLEGGLNMIDIDKFNQALKLTWIRRYFNTSSTWKKLIDSHLPKLSEVINFSDKFTENIMKTTKNPFWKEVLTYLTIFIKKYKITSKTEAKNTSFLYNSKVKIGNQEINDRKLINNNIFFIHQLMTEDRFLSFVEFKEKYNINFNLFRYMSIVSSVKSFLNRYNFQVKRKQCENQTPFNIILKSKKGAALIYKHIMEHENQQKSTGFMKWNKKIDFSEEEWKKSFRNLKQTTKDYKLIWLQFRISHSILSTNRSVSKFNHQQCHLCQFCRSHSETIHHLFWQCHKTKQFWEDLSNLINKRCLHAHKFRFEEKYVLFCLHEKILTDKTCDLIALNAKLYIYKCKVQHTELNINIFISNLYHRYKIEKYINRNSVTFRNAWGPYVNMFKSLISLDNFAIKN